MIRASHADARPKTATRNGGNDKAMKALQRYQMSKAEKAALKAEIARQASTATCEKPLRKGMNGRSDMTTDELIERKETK